MLPVTEIFAVTFAMQLVRRTAALTYPMQERIGQSFSIPFSPLANHKILDKERVLSEFLRLPQGSLRSSTKRRCWAHLQKDSKMLTFLYRKMSFLSVGDIPLMAC